MSEDLPEAPAKFISIEADTRPNGYNKVRNNESLEAKRSIPSD